MNDKILLYMQNYWPFSALKFDDLKESDKLVKKLAIPQHTKEFVYAVREPESQAIIYVLCVQNLSERSALDAEYLIREIKPDVVVAQIGNSNSMSSSNESDDGSGPGPVPTSSIEVLKQCFVHKINKEKYENVAGSLVLREIFGVGFYGHLAAARNAAEEIGSALLFLESPFVKSVEFDNSSSSETLAALQPSNGCLVPHQVGSVISSRSRTFHLADDLLRSQIAKSVSSHLNCLTPESVNRGGIQPKADYNAPQFAQSVYPLLHDLHNIFLDIPSIGKALAYAQKMLNDVSRGGYVDTQILSEVYIFRIAVEALRIALNNAGRVPLNKLGNHNSGKPEFCDLSVEDKSHALFAHVLRSQTKKYKSIVAIVDAGGLAGLRKHWSTPVPLEVKDMVEELIINSINDGEETEDHSGKKRLLTNKPVVAVGAGATAVLGASSLTKLLPASSTFMKLITFKVPFSMKIMMTQTQKAVAFAFGKTIGPSKVGASSAMKAAASAEKFRAVAHSVIASAEKTSLSAMRTAFYEIMRKRRMTRIGFLPWATFGCSVATCTGLLVYGDGIECAVESLPSAPSIASLGRGIRSLHLASEAVRDAERSRIQMSIESILYRFKKMKKPQ